MVPTSEDVLQEFGKGFDCGQVVVAHFAERVGLSREEALRVSAAFGGGFGEGSTCGAVVGAMVVLGLAYGHTVAGDEAQKGLMAAKRVEFQCRFAQLHPCSTCKDLLGYDVSVPGEFERAAADGAVVRVCPGVVRDAIGILEDMLGQ